MDEITIQNLDRSPMFSAADADVHQKKVHAAEAFMRSTGVRQVTAEPVALGESNLWYSRAAGVPDILIAAANERDVRYTIEQSAPPLQIYGTTGANWEASVIRHIPLVEACSCCLFPPTESRPIMTCATDNTVRRPNGQSVDAALPFLSFAAGLMAASEILKAGMPGYPFSPNRTALYTHPAAPLRFLSPRIPYRVGCLCATRSSSVHRLMISGGRYARLSGSAEAA
jgi:hypothetical protein